MTMDDLLLAICKVIIKIAVHSKISPYDSDLMDLQTYVEERE